MPGKPTSQLAWVPPVRNSKQRKQKTSNDQKKSNDHAHYNTTKFLCLA